MFSGLLRGHVFFSSDCSCCSLNLVHIGLQVWCSKPKSVLQLRLSVLSGVKKWLHVPWSWYSCLFISICWTHKTKLTTHFKVSCWSHLAHTFLLKNLPSCSFNPAWVCTCILLLAEQFSNLSKLCRILRLSCSPSCCSPTYNKPPLPAADHRKHRNGTELGSCSVCSPTHHWQLLSGCGCPPRTAFAYLPAAQVYKI